MIMPWTTVHHSCSHFPPPLLPHPFNIQIIMRGHMEVEEEAWEGVRGLRPLSLQDLPCFSAERVRGGLKWNVGISGGTGSGTGRDPSLLIFPVT